MLIVDAFNVLHAVSAAEPRLSGLTLEGLAALIGVCGGAVGGRFRSAGVVLVCDGTAGGRGWRTGQELARGVRVHLAGPGQDADSLIERMLMDAERRGWAGGSASGRAGGGAILVVSSDRRVQAAAVGMAGGRAKWMSSGDFVRLLAAETVKHEKRRRDKSGDRPPLGAGETLDKDTAAYWLREFGYADGSGSAKQPERPHAAGDQEWGEGVRADDLDMEKWLKGLGDEQMRRDE